MPSESATHLPYPPVAPRRNQLLMPTLAVLLFLLALGLRVTELDAMVNVDMYHLWSKRIVRFMAGLSSGELASTYQSHHPGVVFMWLAGLVWKAMGVLQMPLDPQKLVQATLPVALIGAVFPLASFLLMRRILGRKNDALAYIVGALIATEPLFIAHSRNAHLDMLVTALSWTALLAAIVAERERSQRWAMGCGVLLGLALLTKLAAAGFALGIAAMFFRTVAGRSRDERQRQLWLLIVIAATSALVFVLLWPALWVSPFETIAKLFFGVHQEMDKTSDFMLLGETGKLRLPLWTYGLFLIFLVTPEFLGFAAIGGFLARRADPRVRTFALDTVVATVPLIVLLVGSARIGNRYLIPTLPLLGTLSGIGMMGAWTRMEGHVRAHWRRVVAAGLLLVLFGARTARAVALHPLPITYCSGWTGRDCTDVFHVGWGEGLKEASVIVNEQAKLRGWSAPAKVYGTGYASLMRVWTPISSTKTFSDAQLLVDYLPDRQRRLQPALAIAEFVKAGGHAPLGEVRIAGRVYVRIFPGPKY